MNPKEGESEEGKKQAPRKIKTITHVNCRCQLHLHALRRCTRGLPNRWKKNALVLAYHKTPYRLSLNQLLAFSLPTVLFLFHFDGDE